QPPGAPAPSYTPTEPVAPRPPKDRGVLPGLILIGLGVVALLATWFPARGAWLFLGLSAAFLVARVLTGRIGYAVPAGILLGFGSYVWLVEVDLLSGPAAGGLFFVFLGLGFMASYAIAARADAAWSIVPGFALICFGWFIMVTTMGTAEQFWWLAQYWPVGLVAVGLWLLLREQVPVAARTPVAVVGAGGLILVGLLLAAAGIASVSGAYRGAPMPAPWSMFRWAPTFGSPPIQDTVTRSAPVDSISTIRLVNTSGQTVIRAGTGLQVQVQATRHYWTADQAPDIQLVPANGVLTVQPAPVAFNPGGAPYIDYVIDVPANLGADVRSSSGSIDLGGLQGAVRVESSSGALNVHDLSGSTLLASTSGSIRMANISGDLQVTSTSGGISGASVDRVREARSTSGGIDLAGGFASDAQIVTTSGGVTLRFTPAASVYIDASSLSGDVNASGLNLSGQLQASHRLSGSLGTGATTVSVRTTSGSIRLGRGG
ncbi:MAG TPA: DUF4097 family beta strand repeat-containing protein, partial [Chloroflexota bacterium]